MKTLWIKLNFCRNLIAYIAYKTSKNRNVIDCDIKRWITILQISSKSNFYSLMYLLIFIKEFRNLFYYRIKGNKLVLSKIVRILFPELETLEICTENIGGGLFIQHGFSTIIAAKSIGENCWINQQVTIGYSSRTDAPTIGNNVRVTAGAKVIGNVTLDDNCVVGANAVVVKNVPKNAVVVGVPAKVIKYINS